jgi:hypothetical protein
MAGLAITPLFSALMESVRYALAVPISCFLLMRICPMLKLLAAGVKTCLFSQGEQKCLSELFSCPS